MPHSCINKTTYSVLVSNIGTAGFVLCDKIINANESVLCVWNTKSWYILNTNSSMNIDTYNSIIIESDYTIPHWNMTIIINSQKESVNVHLPTCNKNSQGYSVTICNITKTKLNLSSDNIIYPYNTTHINNIISNINDSINLISLEKESVVSGANLNYINKSELPISSNTGDYSKFLRGDATWKSAKLPSYYILSKDILYTLDENSEYFIDTTEMECRCLFPFNPSLGAIIRLINVNQSWLTNKLTLVSNLPNVINNSNIYIAQENNVKEFYFDSINNWVVNDSCKEEMPSNTWIGNNNINSNKLYTNNNIYSLKEINSNIVKIIGTNNLLNDTSIEVQQANSTQSGYLHYRDWATFNNKQNNIKNPTPDNFVFTDKNGQSIDNNIRISNSIQDNTNNKIFPTNLVHELINKSNSNIRSNALWNAYMNKPYLTKSTGTINYVYYVSHSGYQDILSGEKILYNVGEKIIYNPVTQLWGKI